MSEIPGDGSGLKLYDDVGKTHCAEQLPDLLLTVLLCTAQVLLCQRMAQHAAVCASVQGFTVGTAPSARLMEGAGAGLVDEAGVEQLDARQRDEYRVVGCAQACLVQIFHICTYA